MRPFADNLVLQRSFPDAVIPAGLQRKASSAGLSTKTHPRRQSTGDFADVNLERVDYILCILDF